EYEVAFLHIDIFLVALAEIDASPTLEDVAAGLGFRMVMRRRAMPRLIAHPAEPDLRRRRMLRADAGNADTISGLRCRAVFSAPACNDGSQLCHHVLLSGCRLRSESEVHLPGNAGIVDIAGRPS